MLKHYMRSKEAKPEAKQENNTGKIIKQAS